MKKVIPFLMALFFFNLLNASLAKRQREELALIEGKKPQATAPTTQSPSRIKLMPLDRVFEDRVPSKSAARKKTKPKKEKDHYYSD